MTHLPRTHVNVQVWKKLCAGDAPLSSPRRAALLSTEPAPGCVLCGPPGGRRPRRGRIHPSEDAVPCGVPTAVCASPLCGWRSRPPLSPGMCGGPCLGVTLTLTARSLPAPHVLPSMAAAWGAAPRLCALPRALMGPPGLLNPTPCGASSLTMPAQE